MGIDPGKNGGIAFINSSGNLRAYKCPESASEMASMVELGVLNMYMPVNCYIEKVWAMPGQGVTSMFSFGQNYGRWEGILGVNEIDPIYITPKKWQTIYELPKLEKKERKNLLKAKAQKLLDDKILLGNVKVTLYISDAILIAYYGYLMGKGENGTVRD